MQFSTRPFASDAKNAAFEAAKRYKAGEIDDKTFMEMIKAQVGESKLVEMMKAPAPTMEAARDVGTTEEADPAAKRLKTDDDAAKADANRYDWRLNRPSKIATHVVDA